MMAAASLLPAAALATHVAVAAELEELARRLRQVTVRIGTQGSRVGGVGAGVVWPVGRGFVVTNAHVAPTRRGDTLSIETVEGAVAEGRVVARDSELDLALVALRDAADDWPAPAPLGDARTLRTGELVVALGHPLGVGSALSVGVVHAMPNGDDSWLRADIRLAPGNSGGPLATLDGNVIGVNCMIARGLGIAIPVHVADRFAREAATT